MVSLKFLFVIFCSTFLIEIPFLPSLSIILNIIVSAAWNRAKSVFGKAKSKEEVEDITDDVPDALCKVLNGFFLTVTCRGQIVLISSSVEQHLGHCQVRVALMV